MARAIRKRSVGGATSPRSAYSAPSRSPIPLQVDHRFRSKPIVPERNRGDYKKRVRELRFVLGWDIELKKRRDPNSEKYLSLYVCHSWKPWPPEGARAAVMAYEKRRLRTKATPDEQAKLL